MNRQNKKGKQNMEYAGNTDNGRDMREKISHALDWIPERRGFEEELIGLASLENDERQHMAKRARRKTKKPVRILVQTAAAMLIVAIVSSVSVYAISKQNLLEFFFHGAGKEKAKEFISEKSQSIQVGDYTVTLKESIFEADTRIAYAAFDITKKNGVPEVSLDEDGNVSFMNFGKIIDHESEEDDGGDTGISESSWRQYEIALMQSEGLSARGLPAGGSSAIGRLEGDVLHLYGIYAGSDIKPNAIFCFSVRDQKTGKNYDFDELEKKSESISFTADLVDDAETVITLSPLGVDVSTSESAAEKNVDVDLYEIRCEEISITLEAEYQDGTRQVLVGRTEEEGIATALNVSGSYLSEETYGSEHKFVFKEPIDIKKIAKIYLNGKEHKIN